MKNLNLLDTTLRDGSYSVNYTFTSADTAVICSELESCGIEYIEIGHGVGLGASEKGLGRAVQTDEEYMMAASKALKKAKYGMFCIPGVASLEHIDLATQYGMHFLRVGTDIDKVAQGEKFIKKAKNAGMFVAANFMKSYAVSPETFAQSAIQAKEYGADIIYIVDSAGGMFLEDVQRYFQAVRAVSDIPIGFHGHDNLGLAIANSLEAVKLGAAFVDCTLQGLGRSAGNAVTETLVLALLKKGYALEVNAMKLLEVGRKYIQPLVPFKGKMPLDIVLGYADFHSSYMHHIQKYSAKYSIPPEILIIEMSKVNKVHVDEKILDQVAQKIQSQEGLFLGQYDFKRYVGGEQDERRF